MYQYIEVTVQFSVQFRSVTTGPDKTTSSALPGHIFYGNTGNGLRYQLHTRQIQLLNNVLICTVGVKIMSHMFNIECFILFEVIKHGFHEQKLEDRFTYLTDG